MRIGILGMMGKSVWMSGEAMAEMGTNLPRDFSRVILTLDNVLIPAEKLNVTPSMLDGLDKETEIDLRILGCDMIQTAGILLKLPQVSQYGGRSWSYGDIFFLSKI